MLDPTVAEVLLAPEVRGLSARSFGAAISIAFETVLRDGLLPKSRIVLASRMAEPFAKEVLAHLLNVGYLIEERDGYRCPLADRIISRANIAAALLLAASGSSAPAPKPQAARIAKEPAKAAEYEAAFEEFWGRYKAIGGTTTMNKSQSAKAFSAALGRGATVEDIIAGIDRYAAHQNALITAQPSKRAFVKMPTTWLNQSDWTAEYPVVAIEKPRGSSDPEGAPEPKAGLDYFQRIRTVKTAHGTNAMQIRLSIYQDDYVRFDLPGWLRSKGFPLAAEKAARKDGYTPPDRSAKPREDVDFERRDDKAYAKDYWPGTTIEFDEALWKIGHGEP